MKKKIFIVQLLDSKKPSRTSFTQVEDANFYSNDTDASLVFIPHENSFDFQTAKVVMYNRGDESLVERDAVVTTENGRKVASYELPDEIISHWGEWTAQPVFISDGEIYSGSIVPFSVFRYLMHDRPPRLNEVVTVTKFVQQSQELVNAMIQAEAQRITEEQDRQSAEAVRVQAENERSDKYGSYAQQFNDVITELSEEKDYHSLPEISGARGGFDTLGERLDDTTAQLAQKATQEEVGRKRDKTIPIALEDLSTEVKSVMTGGSVAVVGENAVGSENIKKAAVDPTKTTFLKTGKNLFNKKTRHLDVYASATSGELTNNTSYDASDYIPVNPNETYTRSSNHQIAFYDSEMVFISGDSGVYTFTTPSGTAYIRVTVPKGASETYQLEIGNVATEFEPFGYVFDEEQVDIITGELKSRLNHLDESTKSAIELTQDGRKRFAPMPKGEISTIPADNLALWFKAESIQSVNGMVSEWRDESGFERNVTAVDGEYPKLIPNKYNGLPVVEFSALDYDKPTRLRNGDNMKIASGVKSVTLFVVAESNDLIANTSRNKTPFFLTLGSSSAFIKFELHNEMLISSRRLTGDTLVTGKTESQGLVKSNYKKLSLYEADINFLEGKYELVQDGVTVGKGDLTTKGMTDADSFSRLGIGNVNSSPKTGHGFNGSIGEIIFYNDMKTGGDRKEIRNYLMKKWDIDTLDGHYTAKYSTAILNEGISKSNENLSLISIKNGIDFNVDDPKGRFETMGYLYLDEPNQKLYYSAGRYDNPIYLCDWNRDIAGGYGCEEYNPFIAKNGDIVFARIRSRGNPIIYKSGDYNNPVEIDFGNDSPPVAWLMDTGVDYDYENDFFIFGEYHNPTLPGEDIHVYKVTQPFENRSNWNRVITLEMQENHITTEGTVKHFHTVKRDIYSGMWVANTGDANYQCRNFVSIDGGETWTESGGGSQDYRIVGMIFLEDGCYWANDTQTSHALFKARRGADGYVDFSELEHLTWLSVMQPSYRTCYLEEPNGILIIDRGESRTDLKLDLTFWSFDKKRLYRIDILDGLEGDTGEAFGRIGFGNQAVTAYAPKNENGIILGSTTNWKARPMSVKVLGNSIDKRIGNVKIEVMRS